MVAKSNSAPESDRREATKGYKTAGKLSMQVLEVPRVSSLRRWVSERKAKEAVRGAEVRGAEAGPAGAGGTLLYSMKVTLCPCEVI